MAHYYKGGTPLIHTALVPLFVICRPYLLSQLQVAVKNNIDPNAWPHYYEGISVHWHGLSLKGFAWMDGTKYVTQCPITPGSSFTYKFQVRVGLVLLTDCIWHVLVACACELGMSLSTDGKIFICVCACVCVCVFVHVPVCVIENYTCTLHMCESLSHTSRTTRKLHLSVCAP
jgi:hypothetical protein